MGRKRAPKRATAGDAYRAYVKAAIDRAVEMLARISFGELSQRLDLSDAPDDELTELLWGLNLLAEDLAGAQAEIEAQQTHAQLRRQMWEIAAERHEHPGQFVQRLLDTVGPAMNVMRATYYSVGAMDADAVCTSQWCRPGVPPTPGLRIPAAVWHVDARKGYVEYSRGRLSLPQEELARVLMERTGVGSLAGVLCGSVEEPLGFTMFTDADEKRVWTDPEKAFLLETGRIISTKMAQIRAEAALRDANVRLEAEVARRTEELAAANRSLQEDIARRVKAEGALREREELYRGLVEASPDAILVCAPGGGVLMVNGAAVELFGAPSAEDLLGRNYPDFAIPEDRERFTADWSQPPSGEHVRMSECRFQRNDGTSFLAESRSIAVGDEPAQRTVLCIVRDITARRRQEEDLLRSQKLESLGMLAGGIAHDFNNVLTGVAGALALAREDLAPLDAGVREKVSRLLADAEEAAQRATSLTKQLLTFARGGAPVKTPVRVQEMVESAVRFCLLGSTIRCRTDVAGDAMAVDVDRGQMDQVLNNILINAVQAMPKGGEVTVTARNERLSDATGPLLPGDYVRLSISDTGPGIPREHWLKVFDPYFTTKSDGAGLGLTTAYSVVRRHGGMLTCESLPGQGATFVMLLPAASAAPTAARPGAMPAVERAVAGAGRRVLIMDDDRTVRAVIDKLLKRAGYETVAVGAAAEARQVYADALAGGRRFDAVVMDLTIPGGVGGREAVQELREIDPGVRAIVVSGYSNDPVMAEYRTYGFSGMLAKPFRVNELLQVVAEVIAQG